MNYNYAILIVGTTKNDTDIELFYQSSCIRFISQHWFINNIEESHKYIYKGLKNMMSEQVCFDFETLKSCFDVIQYTRKYEQLQEDMETLCTSLKEYARNISDKTKSDLQLEKQLIDQKWTEWIKKEKDLLCYKIEPEARNELKWWVNKCKSYQAKGYSNLKIIFGIDL
jgi:hypothetical protein